MSTRSPTVASRDVSPAKQRLKQVHNKNKSKPRLQEVQQLGSQSMFSRLPGRSFVPYSFCGAIVSIRWGSLLYVPLGQQQQAPQQQQQPRSTSNSRGNKNNKEQNSSSSTGRRHPSPGSGASKAVVVAASSSSSSPTLQQQQQQQDNNVPSFGGAGSQNVVWCCATTSSPTGWSPATVDGAGPVAEAGWFAGAASCFVDGGSVLIYGGMTSASPFEDDPNNQNNSNDQSAVGGAYDDTADFNAFEVVNNYSMTSMSGGGGGGADSRPNTTSHQQQQQGSFGSSSGGAGGAGGNSSMRTVVAASPPGAHSQQQQLLLQHVNSSSSIGATPPLAANTAGTFRRPTGGAAAAAAASSSSARGAGRDDSFGSGGGGGGDIAAAHGSILSYASSGAFHNTMAGFGVTVQSRTGTADQSARGRGNTNTAAEQHEQQQTTKAPPRPMVASTACWRLTVDQHREWTAVNVGPRATALAFASMCPTGDGRVLLHGGVCQDGFTPNTGLYLLDPLTGTMDCIVDDTKIALLCHRAVLKDGLLMLFGGYEAHAGHSPNYKLFVVQLTSHSEAEEPGSSWIVWEAPPPMAPLGGAPAHPHCWLYDGATNRLVWFGDHGLVMSRNVDSVLPRATKLTDEFSSARHPLVPRTLDDENYQWSMDHSSLETFALSASAPHIHWAHYPGEQSAAEQPMDDSGGNVFGGENQAMFVITPKMVYGFNLEDRKWFARAVDTTHEKRLKPLAPVSPDRRQPSPSATSGGGPHRVPSTTVPVPWTTLAVQEKQYQQHQQQQKQSASAASSSAPAAGNTTTAAPSSEYRQEHALPALRRHPGEDDDHLDAQQQQQQQQQAEDSKMMSKLMPTPRGKHNNNKDKTKRQFELIHSMVARSWPQQGRNPAKSNDASPPSSSSNHDNSNNNKKEGPLVPRQQQQPNSARQQRPSGETSQNSGGPKSAGGTPRSHSTRGGAAAAARGSSGSRSSSKTKHGNNHNKKKREPPSPRAATSRVIAAFRDATANCVQQSAQQSQSDTGDEQQSQQQQQHKKKSVRFTVTVPIQGHVPPYEVIALASLVQESANLRTLDLGSSVLDFVGARRLFEALSNAPHVTKVRCSDENFCSSKSAAAAAAAAEKDDDDDDDNNSDDGSSAAEEDPEEARQRAFWSEQLQAVAEHNAAARRQRIADRRERRRFEAEEAVAVAAHPRTWEARIKERRLKFYERQRSDLSYDELMDRARVQEAESRERLRMTEGFVYHVMLTRITRFALLHLVRDGIKRCHKRQAEEFWLGQCAARQAIIKEEEAELKEGFTYFNDIYVRMVRRFKEYKRERKKERDLLDRQEHTARQQINRGCDLGFYYKWKDMIEERRSIKEEADKIDAKLRAIKAQEDERELAIRQKIEDENYERRRKVAEIQKKISEIQKDEKQQRDQMIEMVEMRERKDCERLQASSIVEVKRIEKYVARHEQRVAAAAKPCIFRFTNFSPTVNVPLGSEYVPVLMPTSRVAVEVTKPQYMSVKTELEAGEIGDIDWLERRSRMRGAQIDIALVDAPPQELFHLLLVPRNGSGLEVNDALIISKETGKHVAIAIQKPHSMHIEVEKEYLYLRVINEILHSVHIRCRSRAQFQCGIKFMVQGLFSVPKTTKPTRGLAVWTAALAASKSDGRGNAAIDGGAAGSPTSARSKSLASSAAGRASSLKSRDSTASGLGDGTSTGSPTSPSPVQKFAALSRITAATAAIGNASLRLSKDPRALLDKPNKHSANNTGVIDVSPATMNAVIDLDQKLLPMPEIDPNHFMDDATALDDHGIASTYSSATVSLRVKSAPPVFAQGDYAVSRLVYTTESGGDLSIVPALEGINPEVLAWEGALLSGDLGPSVDPHDFIVFSGSAPPPSASTDGGGAAAGAASAGGPGTPAGSARHSAPGSSSGAGGHHHGAAAGAAAAAASSSASASPADRRQSFFSGGGQQREKLGAFTIDHNNILCGSQVVATIVRSGCLRNNNDYIARQQAQQQQVSSATSAATESPMGLSFAVKSNDEKEPRADNDPTRFDIVMKTGATREVVTAMLRSLAFCNTGQDEAIGGRRELILSLTHPSGVSGALKLDVDVVADDEPSVVDLGFSPIMCRSSCAVSDELLPHVSGYENPCYFAAGSIVYDFDTADFQGGYLLVTLRPLEGEAENAAQLRLMPYPGSPINVPNPAGGMVIHEESPIGTLSYPNSRTVHVKFGEASINVVGALMRCLSLSCPADNGQTRNVALVFVAGKGNEAVKMNFEVKLEDALVQHATGMRRCRAGFQDDEPLGPFNVESCHGFFDGGFMVIDYPSGWSPEDRCYIQPSKSVTLAPLPKKETEKLLQELGAFVQLPESKQDQHHHHHHQPSASMRDSSRRSSKAGHLHSMSGSDLKRPPPFNTKHFLRRKLADKLRDVVQEKQRVFEEARMRNLSLLKRHNNFVIPEAAVLSAKAVSVDGTRMAVMMESSNGIVLLFDGQKRFVPTLNVFTPETAFGNVPQAAVSKILSHIQFRGSWGTKVVRVASMDNQPHMSSTAVAVEIGMPDEVTHITPGGATASVMSPSSSVNEDMAALSITSATGLPSAADASSPPPGSPAGAAAAAAAAATAVAADKVRTFRPSSHEDARGFCLFEGAQLTNEVLRVFNRVRVAVNLVGNGQSGGDQLTILPPRLQELRGVPPESIVSVVPLEDKFVPHHHHHHRRTNSSNSDQQQQQQQQSGNQLLLPGARNDLAASGIGAAAAAFASHSNSAPPGSTGNAANSSVGNSEFDEHSVDWTCAIRVGQRQVGRLLLDAPTVSGHSSVLVYFNAPPPSLDFEAIATHADAEREHGVVSIRDVERVLQSIAYTNVSPKPKTGSRVYNARIINPDGGEGKINTIINVVLPVISVANPHQLPALLNVHGAENQDELPAGHYDDNDVEGSGGGGGGGGGESGTTPQRPRAASDFVAFGSNSGVGSAAGGGGAGGRSGNSPINVGGAAAAPSPSSGGDHHHNHQQQQQGVGAFRRRTRKSLVRRHSIHRSPVARARDDDMVIQLSPSILFSPRDATNSGLKKFTLVVEIFPPLSSKGEPHHELEDTTTFGGGFALDSEAMAMLQNPLNLKSTPLLEQPVTNFPSSSSSSSSKPKANFYQGGGMKEEAVGGALPVHSDAAVNELICSLLSSGDIFMDIDAKTVRASDASANLRLSRGLTIVKSRTVSLAPSSASGLGGPIAEDVASQISGEHHSSGSGSGFSSSGDEEGDEEEENENEEEDTEETLTIDDSDGTLKVERPGGIDQIGHVAFTRGMGAMGELSAPPKWELTFQLQSVLSQARLQKVLRALRLVVRRSAVPQLAAAVNHVFLVKCSFKSVSDSSPHGSPFGSGAYDSPSPSMRSGTHSPLASSLPSPNNKTTTTAVGASSASSSSGLLGAAATAAAGSRRGNSLSASPSPGGAGGRSPFVHGLVPPGPEKKEESFIDVLTIPVAIVGIRRDIRVETIYSTAPSDSEGMVQSSAGAPDGRAAAASSGPRGSVGDAKKAMRAARRLKSLRGSALQLIRDGGAARQSGVYNNADAWSIFDKLNAGYIIRGSNVRSKVFSQVGFSTDDTVRTMMNALSSTFSAVSDINNSNTKLPPNQLVAWFSLDVESRLPRKIPALLMDTDGPLAVNSGKVPDRPGDVLVADTITDVYEKLGGADGKGTAEQQQQQQSQPTDYNTARKRFSVTFLPQSDSSQRVMQHQTPQQTVLSAAGPSQEELPAMSLPVGAGAAPEQQQDGKKSGSGSLDVSEDDEGGDDEKTQQQQQKEQQQSGDVTPTEGARISDRPRSKSFAGAAHLVRTSMTPVSSTLSHPSAGQQGKQQQQQSSSAVLPFITLQRVELQRLCLRGKLRARHFDTYEDVEALAEQFLEAAEQLLGSMTLQPEPRVTCLSRQGERWVSLKLSVNVLPLQRLFGSGGGVDASLSDAGVPFDADLGGTQAFTVSSGGGSMMMAQQQQAAKTTISQHLSTMYCTQHVVGLVKSLLELVPAPVFVPSSITRAGARFKIRQLPPGSDAAKVSARDRAAAKAASVPSTALSRKPPTTVPPQQSILLSTTLPDPVASAPLAFMPITSVFNLKPRTGALASSAMSFRDGGTVSVRLVLTPPTAAVPPPPWKVPKLLCDPTTVSGRLNKLRDKKADGVFPPGLIPPSSAHVVVDRKEVLVENRRAAVVYVIGPHLTGGRVVTDQTSSSHSSSHASSSANNNNSSSSAASSSANASPSRSRNSNSNKERNSPEHQHGASNDRNSPSAVVATTADDALGSSSSHSHRESNAPAKEHGLYTHLLLHIPPSSSGISRTPVVMRFLQMLFVDFSDHHASSVVSYELDFELMDSGTGLRDSHTAHVHKDPLDKKGKHASSSSSAAAASSANTGSAAAAASSSMSASSSTSARPLLAPSIDIAAPPQSPAGASDSSPAGSPSGLGAAGSPHNHHNQQHHHHHHHHRKSMTPQAYMVKKRRRNDVTLDDAAKIEAFLKEWALKQKMMQLSSPATPSFDAPAPAAAAGSPLVEGGRSETPTEQAAAVVDHSGFFPSDGDAATTLADLAHMKQSAATPAAMVPHPPSAPKDTGRNSAPQATATAASAAPSAAADQDAPAPSTSAPELDRKDTAAFKDVLASRRAAEVPAAATVSSSRAAPAAPGGRPGTGGSEFSLDSQEL